MECINPAKPFLVFFISLVLKYFTQRNGNLFHIVYISTSDNLKDIEILYLLFNVGISLHHFFQKNIRRVIFNNSLKVLSLQASFYYRLMRKNATLLSYSFYVCRSFFYMLMSVQINCMQLCFDSLFPYNFLQCHY